MDTQNVSAQLYFKQLPMQANVSDVQNDANIEDAFQKQGFAKEALAGMWLWACEFPEVKMLRYTVSPDNLASIKVIEYFGFQFMGQQLDEIDGPENIYEESSENFKTRWGVLDER